MQPDVGKAKEEEPYFLRLTQLDTKFELDKTAILGEIALKVMNAGIKYTRVTSYNSYAAHGPVIVTGPKSYIEAVFNSGDFFVRASGRDEAGRIREVDLDMEIAAISDEKKVRKHSSKRATAASKEVELSISAHVEVKLGSIEEQHYIRERHIQKAWEEAGFHVVKSNQQLLMLDDGSRTLTRMDVIHANVIPTDTYGGDLLGAKWPTLLTVKYTNHKEVVITHLTYKLHAVGELAEVICDICHRYTRGAIEEMPRRLGGAHIACQGHGKGKGAGGKGKGAGGGKGRGRPDGDARIVEEAKRRKALVDQVGAPPAGPSGFLPPCKHFWQGTCSRAVKDRVCNFAHGSNADAKRVLCRHPKKRGACRYGQDCWYATEAEYAALDGDARVPLDAQAPHYPPTPAASPTPPAAGVADVSLL